VRTGHGFGLPPRWEATSHVKQEEARAEEADAQAAALKRANGGLVGRREQVAAHVHRAARFFLAALR